MLKALLAASLVAWFSVPVAEPRLAIEPVGRGWVEISWRDVDIDARVQGDRVPSDLFFYVACRAGSSPLVGPRKRAGSFRACLGPGPVVAVVATIQSGPAEDPGNVYLGEPQALATASVPVDPAGNCLDDD